jgi:hypothetical protein
MLSAMATSLLRLDSLSCLLTVISTLLVGRKLWQGWVVAALNSVIICIIGMRTAQFGFLPANLFCIALYAHNLWSWRRIRMPETAKPAGPLLTRKLQFLQSAPPTGSQASPTDANAGTCTLGTAAIAYLNTATVFRLTVP